MLSRAVLISTWFASCVIGLGPVSAGATLPKAGTDTGTATDTATALPTPATKQEAPMDLPSGDLPSGDLPGGDLPGGDLPGRPSVDPIEFPTETPAASVETPALQRETEATASVETPALQRETEATVSDDEAGANGTAPAELPAESPAKPISESRTGTVSVPWRKFTNEEGQFRVAMPSRPVRYTLYPAAGGAASQTYMQMQLVDGAHLEIYTATFVESPGFLRTQTNREEALLNCVVSLGDLPRRSEPRNISLDNERGMEIAFRGEDGQFQVSRCYLVGDRAYMLTVLREAFNPGGGLMPLEEVAPEDASRIAVRSAGMDVFFDSFEILD